MKYKRVSLIALIFLSIILFAACGGGNATNVDSTTNASQSSTFNYNFRSFDLDIDTVDQRDAVEVSYEEEKNGYEAEYKNKMANLNLRNEKAMEQLDSIFSSLKIDPNSTDEEVIQRVSEAFGGVNFTEFELEVEYKDGGEREYISRK
ncbi:YusW family protein [Chungangia koreensis]|uniref:YusW family protein n=1 Tax=Chungangia koreensis TaxID=752657 RepID=A0ABV8X739_9LACT